MEHTHTSTSQHKHNHRHGPAWKRIHRNWLTWVVVAMMLAAMFMYVFSDDESFQPGGPPEAPMPAAAGV